MSKLDFLKPYPTKIVCVGLNYRDHTKEIGLPIPEEPILFMKPLTTLIGHEDYITYPEQTKRLDYEAELAVIIKNKVKNIRPEDADRSILGYTCANDITARDLQKKDGQWTRAKSFDTFCPVGPRIVSKIDGNNLDVECYLNGQLKQKSNTRQFIFNVQYLVSFISKVMTLMPGDLILTGTTHGIGPMKKGDAVEVKIEKIGALKNYIR